jgi:hypothetical protein
VLSYYSPEEHRLLPRIVSVFSEFDRKLAKAPGIDITALLEINMSSEPFRHLFQGFQLNLDYNGRIGSPHVRAVCRLVCSQPAWEPLFDDGYITGISVGQRKGRPVVFTLELGEELYMSEDFEKQKKVIADFVALADLLALKDRVIRHPSPSSAQSILVECQCKNYDLYCMPEGEAKYRI